MIKEQQQSSFYQWLGEQIKRARKNANLTQEELAKQLSLSRVSVANIEKGKQKIQIHTLIETAYYLNMSFEDLYKRALESLKFESTIESRIIREVDPKNLAGIRNLKYLITETLSKKIKPE